MAWFDVAGGRLRFRRVTRHPVREWLASPDGEEAVAAAAKEIRFALFGKARAARRRLAKTLWTAVNSSTVRTAATAECDHFMTAWTQLAYAPALPRLTINGRRLVLVPRAVIVNRAGPATASRLAVVLGAAPPEAFKSFLARWLLLAMNEAIVRAGASPKRPILARELWACVFLEPEFLWVDPMYSGDAWRGHVMMYEMPPAGLRRRDRQALEAGITELSQTLPELSRLQRDSAVRVAIDQMATLQF